MLAAFLTLAALGISPWWLTVLVIARDLAIVIAIAIAHVLALPLRVQPLPIGKLNTVVQVSYVGLMLLFLVLARRCAAIFGIRGAGHGHDHADVVVCLWRAVARRIFRAQTRGMSMASQLALPLESKAALGRGDFIAAPGNEAALAFIDSWPDWPVPAAVLYGPPGSGKTHLVSVWRERAGAQIFSASALEHIDRAKPLIVEDVDSSVANNARNSILFALIEGASRERPVLLTGHEPPADMVRDAARSRLALCGASCLSRCGRPTKDCSRRWRKNSSPTAN